MRFILRSFTGLVLFGLTLGLFGLAAITVQDALETRLSKGERPRVNRERVFSARVITVSPGQVVPRTTVIGEVISRRSLDIRAPLGGTVIELGPNFVEGGQVATGDLLYAIDPVKLDDALALAETDLAEAQAEARDADRALALARDELDAARRQAELRARALDRQKSLLARGASTAAALESAELSLASAEQAVLQKRQALAQAEARVDRAATAVSRREIALEDARRQRADARVTAEFDGVLADVTLVRGGIVNPSERVARLVDPTVLDVAFRVSGAQYRRITGDAGTLPQIDVTVSLDLLGDRVEARGTVSREGATVAAGTSGRQLFAALEPDAARRFRPGDFVTITLEEPPLRGVALIPARAVDPAGGVLVVGEGDRLEAARVDIIRRQGDQVIVRGPDIWGREIVAERTPLLGAGLRVNPLRGEVAVPVEREMLTLDAERRAKLIAFIEGNGFIPEDRKKRIVERLSAEQVPAELVTRIESRMGG